MYIFFFSKKKKVKQDRTQYFIYIGICYYYVRFIRLAKKKKNGKRFLFIFFILVYYVFMGWGKKIYINKLLRAYYNILDRETRDRPVVAGRAYVLHS